MHYVMADIHGEYQRLLKMLDMIQFSNRDILYVLGDLADRGGLGVDVIRDLMVRRNVIVLLGNHEDMLLKTFAGSPGAKEMWMNNGGEPTYIELQHFCKEKEREEIIQWIRGLPDSLDIEVNGRCFHLVHGWPGRSTDERIWPAVRPTIDSGAPLPGKTTIIGHTPVFFLVDGTSRGAIWEAVRLKEEGDHARIFHGNGFLDIDCGCGNKIDVCRLACLRLEDMMEFYV